jgi:hypothetical protein
MVDDAHEIKRFIVAAYNSACHDSDQANDSSQSVSRAIILCFL